MGRWAKNMSSTINHVLEMDKHAIEIELRDVTDGEILTRIGKYVNHHQGKTPAPIVKPIQSDQFAKIVEAKEDVELIEEIFQHKKIEEGKQASTFFYNTLLTANMLGVKGFVPLCIAKIATIVKQMSPDEIKRILAENHPKRGGAKGAADEKVDEDGARPESSDDGSGLGGLNEDRRL